MNLYTIKFSNQALADIIGLEKVIVIDYKAPLTAARYIQGLKDTINALCHFPEAHPISSRRSLSKYGSSLRRINYKQMAIIYSINDSFVYIHRVIPANIISGL